MRFVGSLMTRQLPEIDKGTTARVATNLHSLSDSTDRRRRQISESGEVGFSELIRAALCVVSEFRNSLVPARNVVGPDIPRFPECFVYG